MEGEVDLRGEKTSFSSLEEKQPGNLDIEYLINDVLLVPALLHWAVKRVKSNNVCEHAWITAK